MMCQQAKKYNRLERATMISGANLHLGEIINHVPEGIFASNLILLHSTHCALCSRNKFEAKIPTGT